MGRPAHDLRPPCTALLATALPELDPAVVRFVPHHVAHAASAGLAAPFRDSAVLVADGRGKATSYLAGRYRDGDLEMLASQALPHSLGLMYEEVTDHLSFLRSSDEYKVMALASYGRQPHTEPALLPTLRELVYTTGDGGFVVAPIDWSELAKRRSPDGELQPEHRELAAAVQARLEEVLLELAWWLHRRTGERRLTMAGGVALNCVANTRLAAEGPFDELWVQPASGDAGTALGGALHLAHTLGEPITPMPGADLGRGFADDELARWLDDAHIRYERPSVVLFGPVSLRHWGPPPQRSQHVALWAGRTGDTFAEAPDPGLLRITTDVLNAAERLIDCRR